MKKSRYSNSGHGRSLQWVYLNALKRFRLETFDDTQVPYFLKQIESFLYSAIGHGVSEQFAYEELEAISSPEKLNEKFHTKNYKVFFNRMKNDAQYWYTDRDGNSCGKGRFSNSSKLFWLRGTNKRTKEE